MSVAPSFITPLRYPGGKARLGAWLGELIDCNNLSNCTYIEPYAGGAGAAVYLLVNNKVKNIVINDIDDSVHAFWWSVLNDTQEFVKLISDAPVTIENWLIQREIVRSPQEHSRTALGFAAFFLNRTNRSGILHGGVIGGQRQDGKYKLDARFNKQALIDRINRIASYRERITISNLDAMSLVDDLSKSVEKPFFYLDPPYYNKGNQLYQNHYAPDDHKNIAQTVKALNHPWIVTYDNCPEICELYNSCSGFEFSFHYSTHLHRPVGKEIMYYSDCITLHKPPVMKR